MYTKIKALLAYFPINMGGMSLQYTLMVLVHLFYKD